MTQAGVAPSVRRIRGCTVLFWCPCWAAAPVRRRALGAGALYGGAAVLYGDGGSDTLGGRACIMQIFLLAAPLLRRESDGLTSLSAALLVILLANPFAAAG